MNASLDGLGDDVNFTYFPVNHVDPATGKYECEIDGSDLDCESTKYDACLMDEYCYSVRGGCDSRTQRSIANFLACFEGPYANRETTVNASARAPCYAASGLDVERIQTCYEDEGRVARIQTFLNESKAAMMARLGPSPGYFPHMFVDGAPLANRSWTSLTRSLCDAIEEPPSSFCGDTRGAGLVFRVSRPFGDQLQQAAGPRLDAAVQKGVDVATSAAALPRHFDTDDDALPPGDPSYVDVRATSSATCTVHNTTATCTYDLLNAFASDATRACDANGFVAGLVYGLENAANVHLKPTDIVVTHC